MKKVMKCFNALVVLVKGCPLIIVWAWAVACTPVERVSPTATAVTIARVITPIPATRTLPPAPTATQTLPPPTVTPTATSSPSNTPSPTPDFTCPQPDTPAPFAQPANIAELQGQILTYLNTGGQVGDLANLVASLDIDGDMVTVDMNGDDAFELVANLSVVSEESWPYKEHATWVFQCRLGQYDVIYSVLWGWYHFYDSTILDDLNSDGSFEAIIIDGFAGSACNLEPKVLGWRNGGIFDYSPDRSELRLGCSSKTRIVLEDLDSDGNKELIIAGWTVAHLGYAPSRGITLTFSLQNQTYKLLNTEFAPAQYRIELLDDAQRALNAGELQMAEQLYAQAATDDTLGNASSYLFPPPQIAEERGLEPDTPSEYQRAFAFFRLAALQALSGDEVGVSSTVAQLQQIFPEGTPGHEFVVLTPILTTSLLQGRTPSLACGQVLTHIRANFPDLEAHYYWGGNIAWYRNETICPFTAP